MKIKPSVIFIFCVINLTAQKKTIPDHANRISIGIGGESSLIGLDYSRDVYKSKIFPGIGLGFGTGWTVYTRFEPFNIFGLKPFISPGISYNFFPTLVASGGTVVFVSSTGLAFLPKVQWKIIPVITAGISYYYILSGYTEGTLNGFGPLVKIGIGF